jgi:hypothetical protein
LKVLKEVRPALGMLSFDEAAMICWVVEHALHPISIEADNSIDRAKAVPIAFACQNAVPPHHVVIPPEPSFCSETKNRRPT